MHNFDTGRNELKGPPDPHLPGMRHHGTGWIRGNGPEGFGLYEVKWEIVIDLEGFRSVSHTLRKLNTDAPSPQPNRLSGP